MGVIPDAVKKNVLDLHFQKNMQYFITTVVLLCTYLIGIIIGFLTKQIDYQNGYQLVAVIAVSVVFLSAVAMLLVNFHSQIMRIPEEIRKLRF